MAAYLFLFQVQISVVLTNKLPDLQVVLKFNCIDIYGLKIDEDGINKQNSSQKSGGLGFHRSLVALVYVRSWRLR